jgi:cytochrome c peroxidase
MDTSIRKCPNSCAWTWITAAGAIFALLAGCAGDHDSPAPDEQGLTRAELIGKRIFFDINLSQPPGQACASCHDPALAFSGNAGSTRGVAPGAVAGRFGTRNTPGVTYAKFIPPFSIQQIEGEDVAVGGLFWDGRVATLEAQARQPFFNPSEMNLPDAEALQARLAAAQYAALIVEEFGLQALTSVAATLDAVGRAVAAFERTRRFAPFDSKFDAWRRGQVQLSAQELRGLRLFKDENKGNCAACHPVDESSPRDEDSLFTDFTYDNLGVPRNRRIPANADPTQFDLGLCGPTRTDLAASRPDLCGAVRVPSLRNVGRRVAFFHNGAFSRLRDVVAFYATRETDPLRWYLGRLYDDTPESVVPNINVSEVPYDATPATGPRLTDDEIDAIVAFLFTLNDGYQR